jgi:hypothetical protein
VVQGLRSDGSTTCPADRISHAVRPSGRPAYGTDAATMVGYHDGHTVMRDPECNEFCVEPGPVGR